MSAKNYAYLLFPLIVLSCSSPDESDIPPSAPDLYQPVVTGLYISDGAGPELIEVWGNPSDDSRDIDASHPLFDADTESASTAISVVPEYSKATPAIITPPPPFYFGGGPNPCKGRCSFYVSLPFQGNGEVYVVPARWMGEESRDAGSIAGAVTATPKRTAVAVLFRQSMSAGYYSITWNGQNQKGLPVAPGFYRAYCRVGTHIAWHDFFLYRETSDLPAHLRTIVEDKRYYWYRLN